MIEQREFPVWFSDASELASDYYVVASAVLDDEVQRASRVVQDTAQTFIQQSKAVALGSAYLAASAPSIAAKELQINASVARDWGADLRDDWRSGEYGAAFWQGVEDINLGAERVAEIDVHVMSKINTKEGRQQLLDEGKQKVVDVATDAAGWGMYTSETKLHEFGLKCADLSGKVFVMRVAYGKILQAHQDRALKEAVELAPSVKAAKAIHPLGSRAALLTSYGAGVYDITKAALAVQRADDTLTDAAAELEMSLKLQANKRHTQYQPPRSFKR